MEVKTFSSNDDLVTYSHRPSISDQLLVNKDDKLLSSNALDGVSNSPLKNAKTKNPYEIKLLNLQSDFGAFLKKYETCKEEEKDNFRKMLNVFVILLETTQLITARLYHFKPELMKFTYNFYQKGRLKEVAVRKGKEKFNFFDLLYQGYMKFNKTNYIVSNTILEQNDILYDITGLPILELDLRNKLVVNKLAHGLKYLCDCDNSILLLVNDDEFESPQYCYQILSSYELNGQTSIEEYLVKEGLGNEKLFLNLDEIQDQSEINIIKVNNVLFKLRKFHTNINFKADYEYNNLLESINQTVEEVKELYPSGKAIYTYVSLREIFSSFTRLIFLENKKFEQQINGKFIKCMREDKVVEFKSRWIYSFNVTSDNFEVTIGIHQIPPNSLSPLISYLYTGVVILKSNMSMLNFVDYLPLRDYRQNFFKLKLNRGSYVVVPITTGFYLNRSNEEKIEIEKVLLIENKKDAKKKKITYDFSAVAKNIIDEVFDKFDVFRAGAISFDKLQILYNSVFVDEKSDIDINNEESLKTFFKPFLDDKEEMTLKGFRNFFFSLAKSKGENQLYKVFKNFGYNEIINYDCRHFFLSFNSNEQFEIKLSDGLNNKFNSYAFELYLKHVGTIMNTSNNKYINLIYDQTRDSCNVILMLENKSENEKKVTLDIESTGYTSLNGYKYKNTLKPRECKYLFAIAIDKGETKEFTQQSLLIKYHIICE